MIDKDKLIKIIPFVVVALLIVAIPATLYLVKQYQTLKSRAAVPVGAVTLSLSPNEVGKNVGEEFEVQLMMNARNQDITGVDIQLTYDKNILQLVSFNPALSSFDTLRNSVDDSLGQFRFTAVRKPKDPISSGILTLGTLKLRAKAGGVSTVRFAPAFELVASGVETTLTTAGNIEGKYSVVGPGVSPPPSPPPPVTGCSCQADNGCSSPCQFTKLTGVNYGLPPGTGPIQCSLPAAVHNIIPTSQDKNGWCNRQLRTTGDADGNGVKDENDYLYWLTAVNLGKVPVSVNPDFDGDGQIDSDDLEIWRR